VLFFSIIFIEGHVPARCFQFGFRVGKCLLVVMGDCLIAVLGIGKGTWGHVKRLIDEKQFEEVVLISNEWGKENFKTDKQANWVMVNNRAGFDIIKDEIKKNLPKGDIKVSLISGSGKEHLALLAALKDAGVKYEFIVIAGDGIRTF
jgi:hypothetical protein